jgi:hypothetical protein
MATKQKFTKDYEVVQMTATGYKTHKLDTLTPMRAIRIKCIDCSGGLVGEVAHCAVVECPLYPFRSGHKPIRVGAARKNAFTPKVSVSSVTQGE